MLIVWSIRLSMLLFVATLLAWLIARQQPRIQVIVSAMWTLSFLLFLAHVMSSFHFVHQWSHRNAYLATAKETHELMGVEFGGGVYFNYVFLVAWAVHVGCTWFPAAANHPVTRTLLQLCLLYMLFIAFNGVIVFKAGWLRAAGIAATVVLLVVAANRWLGTRKVAASSST